MLEIPNDRIKVAQGYKFLAVVADDGRPGVMMAFIPADGGEEKALAFFALADSIEGMILNLQQVKDEISRM